MCRAIATGGERKRDRNNQKDRERERGESFTVGIKLAIWSTDYSNKLALIIQRTPSTPRSGPVSFPAKAADCRKDGVCTRGIPPKSEQITGSIRRMVILLLAADEIYGQPRREHAISVDPPVSSAFNRSIRATLPWPDVQRVLHRILPVTIRSIRLNYSADWFVRLQMNFRTLHDIVR